MNKLNLLLLLFCFILIPLEKSYSQKNNNLYIRFDEKKSEMNVIELDQSKYFRFKMINKGESYKKAIKKYTRNKWDGEYIPTENEFVLFKIKNESEPKIIPLYKVKNYEFKNIKWLREKYFNHFLEAKNNTFNNMYLFYKKNKTIYVAQIDSTNCQAILTKVTYNPPITE